MNDQKKPPFRWAILGCGSIAERFAAAVNELSDAALTAVGSRSAAKAAAFGARFGAAHSYGSYEAAASDPAVDAVYVATPHPMHAELCLLGLNAGKAVLCEKPFTVSAAELEEVIATARRRKLFLMEAMWTRFFPLMAEVRRMAAGGEIGEVRMIQADFGYRAGDDPENRALSPALGGGGLLDVGIYPLSLASMLFGAPTRAVGLAHLGETGVDEQAGLVLSYTGGRLAVLSCGVRTDTPQEGYLLGTEGRIHIHAPWWKPSRLTIFRHWGDASETREIPFEGNGYRYQAAEVAECVRRGETESKIMPLAESLTLMQTMDDLRAQWGLRYPGE